MGVNNCGSFNFPGTGSEFSLSDLGEQSLLNRTGHGSMLIAPLVGRGEVTGVLVALAAAERPWTRAETSRARIVGHQLGSVVEVAPPGDLVSLPVPGAQAVVQR